MENRRAAHGVLFNGQTTVYNPNNKFFVQKLRSTKQGMHGLIKGLSYKFAAQ